MDRLLQNFDVNIVNFFFSLLYYKIPTEFAKRIRLSNANIHNATIDLLALHLFQTRDATITGFVGTIIF